MVSNLPFNHNPTLFYSYPTIYNTICTSNFSYYCFPSFICWCHDHYKWWSTRYIWFQCYLGHHFQMKNMGSLIYFLGLEVSSRSDGYYIFISSKICIWSICLRWYYWLCYVISTTGNLFIGLWPTPILLMQWTLSTSSWLLLKLYILLLFFVFYDMFRALLVKDFNFMHNCL